MHPKMYVILSLKHSTKDQACFWRSNDAGYTVNPWQAGMYTEEQIQKDQSYYNSGVDTVAICINNSSVLDSGLKISIDPKKIAQYRKENRGEIKK